MQRTDHKTIHQRIEHMLRARAVLCAMLAIMFVALIKADHRLGGVMREFYYYGFGMLTVYLHHEEVARNPAVVSVHARHATSSGQ